MKRYRLLDDQRAAKELAELRHRHDRLREAAQAFLAAHGEIEEWEHAHDEYLALVAAAGPQASTEGGRDGD